MQKSFMQPGPMGIENQGIIVSMLRSGFLHTVSIAWLPQGIKFSIAFGKPSNTTTVWGPHLVGIIVKGESNLRGKYRMDHGLSYI